jgi:hypothetical protein
MPVNNTSAEEVRLRAEQIYADSIRSQVESDRNAGKVVVIDTQSGAYGIGMNSLLANKELRRQVPDADPYALFAIRIGHTSVYTFDDVLADTKI